MLTTRLAGALLSRIDRAETPAELLAHLAFEPPVALPDSAVRALGVPDTFTDARIALGEGSLRAIALTAPAGQPLRGCVAHLAQRLVVRAPHQHWLAVVVRPATCEGAVAAWTPNGNRARVSALLCDGRRVLDSDVETLVALAAAATGGGTDLLVHARWCEILGRESLSRRFFRVLEKGVIGLGSGARGNAPADARRILALTATSRLVFVAFLQTRGWLDGDADFLVRRFDAVMATGGDVHRRFLEPLFFGTLNTPPARRAAAARAFGRIPFLNGGLFARSPVETRYRTLRFRDDELAALFDDVLTRYRFTAREEFGEWSEAAIDPEMLGRAFESLMASRERRESGAYYTPQALVARVSDAALDTALDSAGVDLPTRQALIEGGAIAADATRLLRPVLGSLRVLDPACGSGAFLVYLLDRLTSALRLSGDPRSTGEIRRGVLTRSIFGVDCNPMAVWLCELRLWLSVVIDLDDGDPARIPPLPNLDRNIRVGDALSGGLFSPGSALPGAADVTALRARYARATGRRKQIVARHLDRCERQLGLRALDERLAAAAAERRRLLAAARGRDLFGGRRGSLGSEAARLEELRHDVRAWRRMRQGLATGGALPFRFASHFADATAAGGFDIVVGNPPWVRYQRIPAAQRDALRREFAVLRDPAWRRGAVDAGAGAGFASQVDLAALFTERGIGLARAGGVLAMLLPVKLWRALAGGGLRRLLSESHELRVLEDWSEAPSSFDAAAYPSLLVVRRRAPRSCLVGGATDGAPLRLAVHRRDLAISWTVDPSTLPFDESPGAPWLLLPPEARQAFHRIREAGIALADSHFGRPSLGVKCGCNDAFVLRVQQADDGVSRVRARGRSGEVESSLLRPLLRGEAVRAWRAAPSDERIIWTHEATGAVRRSLPPLAAAWFGRWRRELLRRVDARAGIPWWSLFRVDGAVPHRPRVVWADLGRSPRACVLPAGDSTVPLNTCYVVSCRDDADAAALTALLNSPLVAGWLDAIAEPARGGFRRYLAWTVSRLPIPTDWARARALLAPLGARGVAGMPPSSDELLDACARAYRLRAHVLRPLLEWTWR